MYTGVMGFVQSPMAFQSFVEYVQLLRGKFVSTLVERDAVNEAPVAARPWVAHIESLSTAGDLCFIDLVVPLRPCAPPIVEKHCHAIDQTPDFPEFLYEATGSAELDPARIPVTECNVMGTWRVEVWQLRRALFFATMYDSLNVCFRFGRENGEPLSELQVYPPIGMRQPGVLAVSLPIAQVAVLPTVTTLFTYAIPQIVLRALLKLAEQTKVGHVQFQPVSDGRVRVQFPASESIRGAVVYMKLL